MQARRFKTTLVEYRDLLSAKFVKVVSPFFPGDERAAAKFCARNEPPAIQRVRKLLTGFISAADPSSNPKGGIAARARVVATESQVISKALGWV